MSTLKSEENIFIKQLPNLENSTSWFERVRNLHNAIIFDSVADINSNYSFHYDIITASPEAEYQLVDGHFYSKKNNDKQWIEHKTPVFELLEKHMPREIKHDNIPFTGGYVGYWGYELNNYLEPSINSRHTDSPQLHIGIYLWAIIVDHAKHETWFVSHPDLQRQKQTHILKQIYKPMQVQKNKFRLLQDFTPTISYKKYSEIFYRIKSFIDAGDCYQVNLAQEYIAFYQGDIWQAYLAMRQASPAPFSAFLDFGKTKILSHSPESWIRSDKGKVESRPIKGTRPRDPDPKHDISAAQELMSSEKDHAENLMIVDLVRNDLGKNCISGSIKATPLFQLASYSNVHHLVSTITGQLRPDCSNLELLKNSFPGGSVTGAPKIRAMQIIRELEHYDRFVYCGSIGYLSCHGRMDLNIAIRTMVAENSHAIPRLRCWGGGAIVADSNCNDEYLETIDKIKNLMSTLETIKKYEHD